MTDGPTNTFLQDGSHAGFDTTQWSLIARAGQSPSPEADAALEKLCRAYWRPVYAEFRRRGCSPADAQDLTQELFAEMLRRNTFGRAEKEKGRFRSYLLAALNHVLADHWRDKKAAKRGGGAVLFSLDAAEGESWCRQQPAPGASPAEAFDQRWSLALMDLALTSLENDYAQSGRQDLFRTLQPFLAAETRGDGYEDARTTLGLTPQALNVAVHRMRRRFREKVRMHVAMTVADPAEIDDELRHLFGIGAS